MGNFYLKIVTIFYNYIIFFNQTNAAFEKHKRLYLHVEKVFWTIHDMVDMFKNYGSLFLV